MRRSSPHTFSTSSASCRPSTKIRLPRATRARCAPRRPPSPTAVAGRRRGRGPPARTRVTGRPSSRKPGSEREGPACGRAGPPGTTAVHAAALLDADHGAARTRSRRPRRRGRSRPAPRAPAGAAGRGGPAPGRRGRSGRPAPEDGEVGPMSAVACPRSPGWTRPRSCVRAVDLALGSVECQRDWAATGRRRRPGSTSRRAAVSEDRRLAVLRAIVEDYVATQEPVGSQGAGRAAPARRVAGDDPQRHGGAGGGGATSPSRTPAPAGSPPTRATGCSSTGSPRSSRCPRPSGRAIAAFLRRRGRPRRRRATARCGCSRS